MDKELIKKAFREFKKEAKADYSITAPDRYGDCQSCVNYELANDNGITYKNIYLSREDAEKERTWLYDSKIGKHIYIREV